jgi:hypothetical protein
MSGPRSVDQILTTLRSPLIKLYILATETQQRDMGLSPDLRIIPQPRRGAKTPCIFVISENANRPGRSYRLRMEGHRGPRLTSARRFD